jgi:O-antigen/teichoic acid export membrane protein
VSSGAGPDAVDPPAGPEDLLASSAAGRRFLRGASLRSASYTFSLLIGATVTPFITRHLGRIGWGRYVTVASLLAIAVALTEGGLSSMGVREFSTEGDHDRREYMSTLLGLRLVLSGAAAAGSIAFALIARYPTVMVEGAIIGCLGIFLNNVQSALAVVLVARLRVGWMAFIDFLMQTVSVGWMVVLIILGAPLLPFYAATTVAAGAVLLTVVLLVRQDVSFRPNFDPARWRALASETFVYAAATALGVVYAQVVVVATELLTTGAQTGYFGLGFRVLQIAGGLPWIIVATAFPILTRAASSDPARLRYALGRLSEVGLLLGGALSIGLVIGAPFIVEVLGGSREFSGSVAVLRILGAGIPATFLVATWSYALLSLQAYRPLVLANAVAVAVAVVLCVTLIPSLGARGSAVVAASLEIILATVYAVILGRIGDAASLDRGRMARMVLAFGAAYAAGLLLPGPPVLRTIYALVVLMLGVVGLRLFPEEFVEMLRPGR